MICPITPVRLAILDSLELCVALNKCRKIHITALAIRNAQRIANGALRKTLCVAGSK